MPKPRKIVIKVSQFFLHPQFRRHFVMSKYDPCFALKDGMRNSITLLFTRAPSSCVDDLGKFVQTIDRQGSYDFPQKAFEMTGQRAYRSQWTNRLDLSSFSGQMGTLESSKQKEAIDSFLKQLRQVLDGVGIHKKADQDLILGFMSDQLYSIDGSLGDNLGILLQKLHLENIVNSPSGRLFDRSGSEISQIQFFKEQSSKLQGYNETTGEVIFTLKNLTASSGILHAKKPTIPTGTVLGGEATAELVINLKNRTFEIRNQIIKLGDLELIEVDETYLSQFGLQPYDRSGGVSYYWIDPLSVDLNFAGVPFEPWRETESIGVDYFDQKFQEFLNKRQKKTGQPLSVAQARTFEEFFFSEILSPQFLEKGMLAVEAVLESTLRTSGLSLVKISEWTGPLGQSFPPGFRVEYQSHPQIHLDWQPNGRCQVNIEIPLALRNRDEDGALVAGKGQELAAGTLKYTGRIAIAPNGAISLEDFQAEYRMASGYRVAMSSETVVGLKRNIRAIKCESHLPPTELPFNPHLERLSPLPSGDTEHAYRHLYDLNYTLVPLKRDDPERTTHPQALIADYTYIVALRDDTVVTISPEKLSDVRKHEVKSVLACEFTLATAQSTKVTYYDADCTDRQGARHRKGDFSLESVTQDEALFKTLRLMQELKYTSVDIGDLSTEPKEGQVLSSQARAWLALQAFGLPAYVRSQEFKMPEEISEKTEVEMTVVLRRWERQRFITHNQRAQVESKLEMAPLPGRPSACPARRRVAGEARRGG